jgi:hypothetical protein
VKFSELGNANLSAYWQFSSSEQNKVSVYGIPDQKTVFERINHIATHNLFTSIFDLFLKAYARTVNEAKPALELTITKWDQHQPHYALFLAYLRLFEYARTEMNTLTQRHLDFYYREILRLKEKPTKPSKAHLLVELAKHIPTHLFKAGELFKAGKDNLGKPVFFANDRDFVANQAKVTALKTVYQHGDEPVGITKATNKHQGRFYASAVANSANGLGAELTSVDKSWHPFHNKVYQDGKLSEISMPQADIGFAVASHYLFMAEGERTVALATTHSSGTVSLKPPDYKDEIICLLTSVDGWIELVPETFIRTGKNLLELRVKLNGADPAISGYDAKVHGYGFVTNLPLLIVKIKHTDNKYIYRLFQDITITNIALTTKVSGLRTLAVSNDFGPVGTSKPFLPFGALPKAKSSLIIGSKEVFQKNISCFKLAIKWQVNGIPYPSGNPPTVTGTWLENGTWDNSEEKIAIFSKEEHKFSKSNYTTVDAPDLSENVFYSTNVRSGFLRLSLDNDFGQVEYQNALMDYLIAESKKIGSGTKPDPAPAIPIIESLSVEYEATQNIDLSSGSSDTYANRKALFFHVTPFGHAEQHHFLGKGSDVYLFPQFNFQRENTNNKSEAELYIGVTDLNPPPISVCFYKWPMAPLIHD